MDAAICKICGTAREIVDEATTRQNLPAYFCLLCDGNMKPDAKRSRGAAKERPNEG